jgi:hypothetical protein
MLKAASIIFYSANSQLAYHINENFYGKHFVWCGPVFDSSKVDHSHIYSKIPPSSNPYFIYSRLKEDVVRSDLHSPLILNNKAGLKRGALKMLEEGTIDKTDFTEINYIIDKSQLDVFRPFMYLIPFEIVKGKIIEVDVMSTANPLSKEYQVVNLLREEFSLIEF